MSNRLHPFTVLRDGETVGTKRKAEVTRSELINMIVGRDLAAVFPKRKVPIGDIVLDVRGLGNTGRGLHNITLSVRAGEILGVAGLVGAGRTELAETIFGLTTADEGEILLRGKQVRISTPSDAIRSGIAGNVILKRVARKSRRERGERSSRIKLPLPAAERGERDGVRGF